MMDELFPAPGGKPDTVTKEHGRAFTIQCLGYALSKHGVDMGPKRIFQFMADRYGVLYRDKGRWLAGRANDPFMIFNDKHRAPNGWSGTCAHLTPRGFAYYFELIARDCQQDGQEPLVVM